MKHSQWGSGLDNEWDIISFEKYIGAHVAPIRHSMQVHSEMCTYSSVIT